MKTPDSTERAPADPYACLDEKALAIPANLARRIGKTDEERAEIEDACVIQLLRSARRFDPAKAPNGESDLHRFLYSDCLTAARSLRYYIHRWLEGDRRASHHVKSYGVLVPSKLDWLDDEISRVKATGEPPWRAADAADEIRWLLSRLEPLERTVYVGHLGGGLSLAELARQLSVSKSAAQRAFASAARKVQRAAEGADT